MRILYMRESSRTGLKELQVREFSRAAAHVEDKEKYIDFWGGQSGGCLRFRLYDACCTDVILEQIAKSGYMDMTMFSYIRISSHSSISQYDQQVEQPLDEALSV